MAENKKLSEVFKTVGLPPYTYVKPKYFGEVRADVQQPGKHLLVEGPSGIGKTCVVFKVFEELGWQKDSDYTYISARDPEPETALKAFFDTCQRGERPSPSVMVVDDFHLLPAELRNGFGAMLKRLSDRAFEEANPPKVILIGIPTTGNALLADAFDLGPRIGSYRFTSATDGEINKVLDEGENALNVIFEDRNYLLAESSGNFWLAQFIANKICSMQEIYESQEEVRILTFDLLTIRQRLMDELSQRCMPTALTFSKGKKWRPGGNKPYLDVLFALAKNPDLVVSYDKILNLVPDRRRPGVKAIRPRIAEVINDPIRGIDLRRQIAFDATSGFTVEDPLFRYFLSNVKEVDIYTQLGIDASNIDRARTFAYDIGFSFAGEVRPLAETINEELKSEDVLTFYDFDQQAFLLAENLENVLGRVYSESCAFYLVFLDENYIQKVWTQYERDIMTHSGRSGHIVPVILDEVGAQGVQGIPSVIGRIDLRAQWAELKKTNARSDDMLKIIRNRCVLPMLEKLNEQFA